MMDRQEFQDLIDAHGIHEADWPTARRAAAIVFKKTHADAAAMLSQAITLDTMLRTQASISPQLRQALSAIAQRRQGERLGDIVRAWWRMAAPAVAASALLGFVLGSGLPGLGPQDNWPEDANIIAGLAYATLPEEAVQ
jgi:hypothetical protein